MFETEGIVWQRMLLLDVETIGSVGGTLARLLDEIGPMEYANAGSYFCFFQSHRPDAEEILDRWLGGAESPQVKTAVLERYAAVLEGLNVWASCRDDVMREFLAFVEGVDESRRDWVGRVKGHIESAKPPRIVRISKSTPTSARLHWGVRERDCRSPL